MAEAADPGASRWESRWESRRAWRSVWRWAWPQFWLALVVGVGWWQLAPGGRSDLTGDYLQTAEAPGSQDSWLAFLGVAAGVAVALLWVARRAAPPDQGSVGAIAGALVGGLVAGVAAAGAGLLIDLLTPAVGGPDIPGAVTELRLRSPAVMLLWPLTLTVLVLVDTSRDMVGVWLRQRWRRANAVS